MAYELQALWQCLNEVGVNLACDVEGFEGPEGNAHAIEGAGLALGDKVGAVRGLG
jgi:hypothetical protein